MSPPMEESKGDIWSLENYCLSTLDEVSMKLKSFDLTKDEKLTKKRKKRKKRSKKMTKKLWNLRMGKELLVEEGDFPFAEVLPNEFEHSNFRMLCDHKMNWKMFVNPLKLKVVDEMFVDRLVQLHKLQLRTIELEINDDANAERYLNCCDSFSRENIPKECSRWKVKHCEVGKKQLSVQNHLQYKKVFAKPENRRSGDSAPREKIMKKQEKLLPLRQDRSDHFVDFLNFTSRHSSQTTCLKPTKKLPQHQTPNTEQKKVSSTKQNGSEQMIDFLNLTSHRCPLFKGNSRVV